MIEPIKCQYPGFVGDVFSVIEDSLINSWGPGRDKYQVLCQEELKRITGRKYALMLSHGTSALITSLKSLALGPQTKIGVPSFSWISCASSIIHAGHQPVFLDVDPETSTLGEKAIEQIIDMKIKVVMIVHMLGAKVDDKIIDFLYDESILVVEDATHSLDWSNRVGTSRARHVAGAIGACSCFSFQATKTVTGGQGGALVTDSEELYQEALSLSRHGMNFGPDAKFYWSERLGDNFPASDFQCSIIYSQLRALETISNFRRATLKRFISEYAKINSPLFSLFPSYKNVDAVYLPLVMINSDVPGNLQRIIVDLIAAGSNIRRWNIEIRPSTYPLHKMPTFKEYYDKIPTDLSNTETLSATTFILPFGNKFPPGYEIVVLERISSLLQAIITETR